MTEVPSAETAMPVSDTEPLELVGPRRPLAAALFVWKLGSAAAVGGQRCFWEENPATQHPAGPLAEGSTALAELTPEARAKLDAMLHAAINDIIEDGMRNSVTDRLPGLVAGDFNSVVPALLAAIESGRTTPVIGAEVLKELGRFRNIASHSMRRWVLERALRSPSPYVRDGAGLGLARLGDPSVLPSLRRAVENAPDPQARADLQLVVDELSEMIADGAPFAKSH